MEVREGSRLPDGKFTVMKEGGPQAITTDQIFAGKRVVLFSVPGAFTPTCTKDHLPGYLRNYDAIRAKGFDTIACMAVNDVFVMDAWARDRGVGDKLLMLADGSGEYATQLGLAVDASSFGFGLRSKRFSMTVEDGVVQTVHVEQGGFSVTSAENTCGL